MAKVKKDEYYFDRTIVFDNAIVNVYRPVLTDEENDRRMKRIHDSAAELLKEKKETAEHTENFVIKK